MISRETGSSVTSNNLVLADMTSSNRPFDTLPKEKRWRSWFRTKRLPPFVGRDQLDEEPAASSMTHSWPQSPQRQSMAALLPRHETRTRVIRRTFAQLGHLGRSPG